MVSSKRSKNLIEKMGFNDKDIKTSLHDEICLFLSNKFNVKKVLFDLGIIIKNYKLFHEKLVGWDWDKEVIVKTHTFNFFSEEKLDDIRNSYLEFKKRGIQFDLSLEFEYVIKGYNGFNIGFTDLLIRIKNNRFNNHYFENKIKFIFNNNEYNGVVVEVKSCLPSFGEIVREINFYKSNMPSNMLFVVIAPDCSFVEELKSQNILFWKYDKDKMNGGNK